MFSLRSLASINLSYSQAMQLDESQLSIFSIGMIEPIARMNEYEPREDRRGLYDEFMVNNKHACRIKKYKVRGITKEATGRAVCWCYCPNGPLCNCGCGALLTLLMEFRENQRWRTKGPNIPQINLHAPIKNFLVKELKDNQLFYNVRRPIPR